MINNITRNRVANQRDNALTVRNTLADIGRADWQMRDIQLPVTCAMPGRGNKYRRDTRQIRA